MSDQEDEDYYDDNEDEEYQYEDQMSDQEEDEMIHAVLEKQPPRISSTAHYGTYLIQEYRDIIPIMITFINEVSSLFNVDTDVAEILLQSQRWDRERLQEQFFSNPDKLLDACGLLGYHSHQIQRLIESTREIQDNGETFLCGICRDECNLGSAFYLNCNHRFCRPCFSQYLDSQVMDGPACVKAHCPEHQCSQLAPRSVFRDLASPEAFERYDMYMVRNFIETSKTMRYCPSPNCSKVAVGSGITTIRCSCQNPFCFKCGEEAHDPCNCSQLSQWAEKCSSESETANWILANTKKCPKCSSRIEKNQGCNHMTCKICKHDFCWICMGSWTEHNQNTGGYYKCNRYDPSRPDPSASEAQKAKAELDRYLHYYQRYHGHSQSLSFALSQRSNIEKRMLSEREGGEGGGGIGAGGGGGGGVSYLDMQFLKQASDQIIDCRRVLKYTYVLGYSLADDTAEKRLFEHHQEMLEKNTERLHETLEAQPRFSSSSSSSSSTPLKSSSTPDKNKIHVSIATPSPIPPPSSYSSPPSASALSASLMSFSEYRSHVANLTRVTDRFMSSLLQSLSGGVVDMASDPALGLMVEGGGGGGGGRLGGGMGRVGDMSPKGRDRDLDSPGGGGGASKVKKAGKSPRR